MTAGSTPTGLEQVLAKREEERVHAAHMVTATGILTTVLEDLVNDPSGDRLLARVMAGVKAGQVGLNALLPRPSEPDTALARIMDTLDGIARTLEAAAVTGAKGTPVEGGWAEASRRLASIERTLAALPDLVRPTVPRNAPEGRRELGLFDQPTLSEPTIAPPKAAPPPVKEPVAPVPPLADDGPEPNAPQREPTTEETSVEVGSEGGTGSRGPRDTGRANDIVEVLRLCMRDHGRPVTLDEIKACIDENGLSCIREEKFGGDKFSGDSSEARAKRYDKYVADVLARYALRLQRDKGEGPHAYWDGETHLPDVVDPAYKTAYLPRSLMRQAKSKVDVYNNRQEGSGALDIIWRKAEDAAV